jgi:hypothetical protein
MKRSYARDTIHISIHIWFSSPQQLRSAKSSLVCVELGMCLPLGDLKFFFRIFLCNPLTRKHSQRTNKPAPFTITRLPSSALSNPSFRTLLNAVPSSKNQVARETKKEKRRSCIFVGYSRTSMAWQNKASYSTMLFFRWYVPRSRMMQF